MLRKKTLTNIIRITGTVLAVISFFMLFLPVYSTEFTEGESMSLTMNSFDIIHMYPLGICAIFAPFLLIAIIYIKLNSGIKALSVFAIFLAGSFSMFSATTNAKNWLYENAENIINTHIGLFTYVICLLWSSAMLFIYCNFKAEEISCGTLEEFKKYLLLNGYRQTTFEDFCKNLLLYSLPSEVNVFDTSCNEKKSSGHICFASHDGHFVYCDKNAFCNYTDDDVVETCHNDENSSGFITKCGGQFLYGLLFEDFSVKGEKAEISSFDSIRQEQAEIWIGTENGCFSKQNINIISKDNHIIECSSDTPECFDEKLIGAVIIQDKKICAIISEYNKITGCIYAVSAEKIAKELYDEAIIHELFSIHSNFTDYQQINN